MSCKICGRNSCTESFHSIKAQEAHAANKLYQESTTMTTKTTGQHTPTPYEYPTDCGCIFGDGREIALVHGENRDANAAFICRAANSYDEMLKALCGIVAEYPDPKLPYGKRIVEIARYAIKSATGQG